MIRTILIKTSNGRAALSARVDHRMTQEEMLENIRQAVQEFRLTDPEGFAKHAVDGAFPWEKLFTCFPQHLLEKHGVDLQEYSDIWLEPPEQGIST